MVKLQLNLRFNGIVIFFDSYRLSMVKLQRKPHRRGAPTDSYRLSMVKLQPSALTFERRYAQLLPLEHGEVATPKQFPVMRATCLVTA